MDVLSSAAGRKDGCLEISFVDMSVLSTAKAELNDVSNFHSTRQNERGSGVNQARARLSRDLAQVEMMSFNPSMLFFAALSALIYALVRWRCQMGVMAEIEDGDERKRYKL